MSESVMSWPDLLTECKERGLLAKRLYAVFTDPAHGPGPVLENLDEHLAYQAKLEAEGIMFAAGPFADDAEQEWPGSGMFVYRAESFAEAVKLAEADPMHSSGARSFTVRPWMLNEGTLTVRLNYAAGKTEIV